MVLYSMWMVFLGGAFCLFFYHFHYMMALISLELILLVVFFLMSLTFFEGSTVWSLMIFLMILVCMGAFGLSVLIFFSRGYGSEFFDSFFF